MIKRLLFFIVIINFFILSFSFEICSQDYDPVCGKDNITYFNKCIMNNAGIEIQFSGVCFKDEDLLEEPPKPAETDLDNKTQKDVSIISTSSNSIDSTTKIQNPVDTSSNSKFISSSCSNLNKSMCIENSNCKANYKRSWIFFKSYDFCSQKDKIESRAVFLDETIDCSNIVDVVCAEDLNTYPNSCYAENKNLDILYTQRCEEIKCNNYDENSCLSYDKICKPSYSFSFLSFGEKEFLSCSFK